MNSNSQKIFLFFLTSLVLLFTNRLHAQEFEDYKAFTSGKGEITKVRYNATGNVFASGNTRGVVLVRDVQSSTITHYFTEHTGNITALTFHPNLPYLASASADGTIKLWDLNSKTMYMSFPPEPAPAGSFFTFATFNSAGNWFYYGGSDGKIYGVQAFLSGALQDIANVGAPILCADLNNANGNIAVCTKNSIQIVDVNAYKIIKTIVVEAKPTDIKYINSGADVAVLLESGKMNIYNAQTGSLKNTGMVTEVNTQTELAFAPNSSFVVVGSGSNNESKVLELPSLKVTSQLKGHQAPVRSIMISPNGKNILTGANDQMVKIWREKMPPNNVAIPTPPVEPKTTPPTPTPTATLPSKPNITLDKIKLTYTQRNIPDSLGDRKIKAGKRMLVTSENLEITLWDSEEQDGDTISLFLNGDWVLREFPLKNKKHKIKVNINQNADNYLILHAHNEGKRPPNTAAMTIFDGKNEKKVALSSNMKTSDALNFKFMDNKK